MIHCLKFLEMDLVWDLSFRVSLTLLAMCFFG